MVPSPGRRDVLHAAIAGVTAGLAGCAQINPLGGDGESPLLSVALETVVDGIEAPVDVAVHPTRDLRYVATQGGAVVTHGPEGRRDEPLLDLRDRVVVGTEQGLLGVALHPEFAQNRRLFVRYSSPTRAGTPDSYSHTFVLSEFEVSADGTRAPLETERTVMALPQPQDTHNSGDLAFGPDGSLYVPTGDGGGHVDADPGHADDWYETNDGGNGQDVTENLLGSILRIDVDADPTEPPHEECGGADDCPADAGYAIPSDNPLVGQSGRDEQWAWGFRNPWQISFDDGDLFAADVGKWLYEEINLVEEGGNYGWNVREGRHCFDASDPSDTRDGCPDETPADVRGGRRLRDPIVEYPHWGDPDDGINGSAVIGGSVYRGSALPELAGRYVFGDLEPAGRLFVATPPSSDGGSWSTGTLELTAAAADTLDRLLSFGRTGDGELYVLGGGGVHRLVPAE